MVLTLFNTFLEAIPVGFVGMFFAFLVTVLVLPQIMRWMSRHGKTGVDVHKVSKPVVPEMGGVAALLGVEVALGAVTILYPMIAQAAFVFGVTVALGAIVGIIDDFRRLRAWQKPLLTMIASLPILVTGSFSSLFLPVVGFTRLTIVYPLIIPLAFAVCTNTTNMMDVYNGTMTGNFSIIMITLMIASAIIGAQVSFVFAALLGGVTLALYVFNRYPARVFCGDTGSLLIGSGLAALVVMGSVEVVAVVAILPFIMNSFHSLASLGGLVERHDMKQRPVIVTNNGTISANTSRDAPLTLTRLILARGALTEQGIIRNMSLLTLLSCGLALLTSSMYYTDGLVTLRGVVLGCLLVSVCALLFPRAVRGIVLVIGFVWVTALGGLWLIDALIIMIPDPEFFPLLIASQILKIGAASVLILFWLILWNQLVRRYFWRNIVSSTELSKA